jgi:predicted NAD-dependent protein-ADP-ribosyltransferase YbiA (DUF1768 family)
MDLDEVADELYDVHPDEFIAYRKARRDQVRADGDPALAKAIGALPRPSTAAWVGRCSSATPTRRGSWTSERSSITVGLHWTVWLRSYSRCRMGIHREPADGP